MWVGGQVGKLSDISLNLYGFSGLAMYFLEVFFVLGPPLFLHVVPTCNYV